MKIRLHIERLVVEGVTIAPGQGARLQASVEHELARLLRAEGLGAVRSGGATPSVSGGAVHFEAGASSAQMGRQIAAAVYRGLRT